MIVDGDKRIVHVEPGVRSISVAVAEACDERQVEGCGVVDVQVKEMSPTFGNFLAGAISGLAGLASGALLL